MRAMRLSALRFIRHQKYKHLEMELLNFVVEHKKTPEWELGKLTFSPDSAVVP